MARTDLPYLEQRLKELDSEWDNLQRNIKIGGMTPSREAMKKSLLRHIEYVESEIRFKRNKFNSI